MWNSKPGYLRRTVVVDGSANGAALVNQLLATMRALFDRSTTSCSGHEQRTPS